MLLEATLTVPVPDHKEFALGRCKPLFDSQASLEVNSSLDYACLRTRYSAERLVTPCATPGVCLLPFGESHLVRRAFGAMLHAPEPRAQRPREAGELAVF